MCVNIFGEFTTFCAFETFIYNHPQRPLPLMTNYSQVEYGYRVP